MRDIALFTRLRDLPDPGRVEGLDFDPEEQPLDLGLVHRRNATVHRPECGARSPLQDRLPWRKWRPRDRGESLTWLQARPPRIDCPVQGIHQVRLPRALPGCRFTIPVERRAIAVRLRADVLGGAGLLRISWDEAWHLRERAVARGQQARPRRALARLGGDEKAASAGHRSVTPVFDPDRSPVESGADDRKRASLDAFDLSRSPEQRAGIEAVAMAMGEPFITSPVEHVPDGRSKIVFDRFHVMKYMTGAVDAVRKWGHRRLQAEGDDALKKTKYLGLYSEENLPESGRERFAALRAPHLKTGRARAIKEALRDLGEYRRRGWALRHRRHRYFWATHSRLTPVIEVARMIRDHRDNVLTSLDHRITTATCAGFNSPIRTIKKTPRASAIGTI